MNFSDSFCEEKRMNKRNFQTAFAFLSFIISIFSFTTCTDIWGVMDDPADPESSSYQGFPTVEDENALAAVRPEDGGTLSGTTLTVSKVTGATAYAVRIATSASALGVANIYEKSDFPTNVLDISASPIENNSTYWWQARVTKDGTNWGDWSIPASFGIRWTTPAATPTFTPIGDSYATDQIVTISCSTNGAKIYFSTDGSTPTELSTLYTEAINVASHGTILTIKAISVAAGHSRSTVGSVTYTIDYPQAATPTFSPPGGTYNSDQSVIINCATNNSTIYYTTDGSTPTTSSNLYTEPIEVAGHGSTANIKAISSAIGNSISFIAEQTYVIEYPETSLPYFTPSSGYFTSNQSVTISCDTHNAIIYYTIDGSDPSYSSTRQSSMSPVESVIMSVNPGSTIRAIALSPGYSFSTVATAFYRVPYLIGDTGPAGGVVFYDKGYYSEGWQFLEAARSDQSSGINWNNSITEVVETGANSVSIGSGLSNTSKIISAQNNGEYAAAICANFTLGGFNDWFLPSIEELSLMYNKKGIIGNFAIDGYWSSTEINPKTAFYIIFGGIGGIYDTLKSTYNRVRAIRAF